MNKLDQHNSVARPLLISLSVFFFIVVSIFAGMTWKIMRERQNAQKNEIDAIRKTYLSRLSEKVGLVAQSDQFIDFLRSGKTSREQMKSEVEYLTSPLVSEEIFGFSLYDKGGNTILSDGKKQGTSLHFNLCYLARTLDSDLGDCQGRLTLYLNRDTLFQNLKKMSPKIAPCPDCYPVYLIQTGDLHRFKTTRGNNINLGIHIPNEDIKSIFIVFGALIILFFLFSFMISMKMHSALTDLLWNPIENIISELAQGRKVKEEGHKLKEFNFLTAQINLWMTQAEKSAEVEKNAEIGRVTSQVLHDIRSPLTVLESMGREESLESSKEIFHMAIARIRTLADNLLDQRRQHLPKFHPLEVTLQEIWKEKIVEYRAFGKVDWKLDINNDLQTKINPFDLKQVLSNLINNSVEALPNEQGSIQLTSERLGEYAKITISDTGPGMSAELVGLVTEEGFTQKPDGNGLGLYHAKATIEKAGGDLQITSQDGKGTQITIYLPCRGPTNQDRTTQNHDYSAPEVSI